MLRLAAALAVAVVLLATATSAQRRGGDPPDDPPVAYGPITEEQSGRVIAAAGAFATQNGWPALIVILNASGVRVRLLRPDTADAQALDVAMTRARMVLDLAGPSRPSGGIGMSLVVDTRLVGAIGVAGVTTEQAAQIARAGVDALK